MMYFKFVSDSKRKRFPHNWTSVSFLTALTFHPFSPSKWKKWIIPMVKEQLSDPFPAVGMWTPHPPHLHSLSNGRCDAGVLITSDLWTEPFPTCYPASMSCTWKMSICSINASDRRKKKLECKNALVLLHRFMILNPLFKTNVDLSSAACCVFLVLYSSTPCCVQKCWFQI